MHFYFKNQRFPTVFVVQIPQNFPLKVKILKSVVFCPKPLKSVVFAGHPPTPGGGVRVDKVSKDPRQKRVIPGKKYGLNSLKPYANSHTSSKFATNPTGTTAQNDSNLLFDD